MNKAQLQKAQEITAKIVEIQIKVDMVQEQIDFIKTANKHRIFVEKVTLVEDPNPETDSWGWSSQPMKEHTECRNYSIDKSIMIDALTKNRDKLNEEIEILKKNIQEI